MQPEKIIALPVALPDTAYLSALPIAVMIATPEGRIRFLNAAGELMLGISSEHATGKPLAELFHTDAKIIPLVQRVFEGGAVLRDHEHVLQPQRATAQRVNLLMVPVREPQREVILFFDAPAAMQAMTEQATQRGVARAAGTIAAMLAHEVKNPLAGIRGAAQLLAEESQPQERALAELICREVERIRQLLDEFEALSDPTVETPQPVNIHEALDDACALMKHAHATIACDKRYDPSLPAVLAKRERLVQVFLNLIKNAAEALEGAAEPRIVLTTSYKSGVRLRRAEGEQARAFVCVTVEDNGCGIAQDLRETLFQPFVSGKQGGRGLGLAVAYKLISDFGGMLELESSQPGCTRMRVLLPCEG